VRNSLSGDASRPNIYRESLGLQGKSRNTMNIEMVEHLRREFEY
jgi:Dullard-like phosphatase family protein